eukprot:1025836-Amphidinium_carterae.1
MKLLRDIPLERTSRPSQCIVPKLVWPLDAIVSRGSVVAAGCSRLSCRVRWSLLQLKRVRRP